MYCKRWFTGKNISRLHFVFDTRNATNSFFCKLKNMPYHVDEPVNEKKNRKLQCQVNKCKENNTGLLG